MSISLPDQSLLLFLRNLRLRNEFSPRQTEFILTFPEFNPGRKEFILSQDVFGLWCNEFTRVQDEFGLA